MGLAQLPFTNNDIVPIGNWTTRGYANLPIAKSWTSQLADWTSRKLDNSLTRGLDN